MIKCPKSWLWRWEHTGPKRSSTEQTPKSIRQSCRFLMIRNIKLLWIERDSALLGPEVSIFQFIFRSSMRVPVKRISFDNFSLRQKQLLSLMFLVFSKSEKEQTEETSVNIFILLIQLFMLWIILQKYAAVFIFCITMESRSLSNTYLSFAVPRDLPLFRGTSILVVGTINARLDSNSEVRVGQIV